MAWVLQRYKVILIILGIVTVLSLAAFIVSKQNIGKAPSRGVFVIEYNLKWSDFSKIRM